LTCWKADCDRAISSLAPSRDIWCLMSLSITPSMLQHAGRHRQVSSLQRRLINICILDSCAGCGSQIRPKNCVNAGIITRMQKCLNPPRVSATH
jgi:hypothetical protein